MTPQELTTIATQMGPGWAPSELYERPALKHTGGAIIAFHPNTAKKQWQIRGVPLQDKDNYTVTPYREGKEIARPDSINVAQSKTPEQIGRDIARRLLPDYMRYHGAALEDLEKMEDREARRLELLNALSSASKGVPLRSHASEPGCSHLRDSFRINLGNPSKRCGYGHLEVNAPDSCQFDLRGIPAGLALKIVTLLAEEMQ